jgi:hypothetical protein
MPCPHNWPSWCDFEVISTWSLRDTDVIMKSTSGTQSAKVQRVNMRLPPSWAEEPAVWFALTEAEFSLVGIRDEQTKFFYFLSQLDHRYATEVQDIVISPPQQNSYTKLKTKLLKRLSPSKERHTRRDRKPSHFLRHLRNLAPDKPDYLLRISWTSRIPSNVQTTLAGMPKVELDAAALSSDCIVRAVSPSTRASTAPITDNTEFQKPFEELPRQVKTFNAGQNSFHCRDHRYRSGNHSYSTNDGSSSSNRSHFRDCAATLLVPPPHHRQCSKLFPALHLQTEGKLT